MRLSRVLVWSFGSRRQHITPSGLRCFPLGALGGSVCLPGAFRRTADSGGSSAWGRSVCLGGIRPLQLVVLQAAQLARRAPGAQRPLLVDLAEGVGAQLAEGLRILPADVTVVPGAVPAACRGRGRLHGNKRTADLMST